MTYPLISFTFIVGIICGNIPSKVEEEEETMYEGKEKVAVQDLGDELKKSEQNRMDLIYVNTALQLKLKASQEEEGRVRQQLVNLEERLLTMLRSQVRKMAHCYVRGIRHKTIWSAICDPKLSLLYVDGAASPSRHISLHHTTPTATSFGTQSGGQSKGAVYSGMTFQYIVVYGYIYIIVILLHSLREGSLQEQKRMKKLR